MILSACISNLIYLLPEIFLLILVLGTIAFSCYITYKKNIKDTLTKFVPWIYFAAFLGTIACVYFILIDDYSSKVDDMNILRYAISFVSVISVGFGLVTLFNNYFKKQHSYGCLEEILKDFNRHMSINEEILHDPALCEFEGVIRKDIITKFKFMESDLKFSSFATAYTHENYGYLHELELNLRNYNIAVDSLAYFICNYNHLSAEENEKTTYGYLTNQIVYRTQKVRERIDEVCTKFGIDTKRVEYSREKARDEKRIPCLKKIYTGTFSRY